jgi:hypothetical protein
MVVVCCGKGVEGDGLVALGVNCWEVGVEQEFVFGVFGVGVGVVVMVVVVVAGGWLEAG